MQSVTGTYQSRDTIKGFFLAVFLLCGLCLSVITAMTNAGPMIVGTEMNANGSIEYMCLGLSCEDYTSFQFSDK